MISKNWCLNSKVMVCVVFLPMLLACGNDTNYTLYRNSPIPIDNPELKRIHVASFDSNADEAYNRENCNLAATLFQGQPGVTVKYWCEKGSYRK